MYACMYVYDIYYKCAVRSYLLMLCWHKLFYQSQFRIPSFGMRTTRWPDLQVWFWCLKVFWFWEKRFAAWVISSVQSVLVPLLSLPWGPRCMTSITCCVMVHKLKRVTVLLVIFLVISPTFDFFFIAFIFRASISNEASDFLNQWVVVLVLPHWNACMNHHPSHTSCNSYLFLYLKVIFFVFSQIFYKDSFNNSLI